MKVSIELMKRYSDVAQWTLSTEVLVARIGRQLGSVDETATLTQRYGRILVVEIIEAKPHPNADKLTVYQLWVGTDHQQVVSGDTSFQVGDKVGWIAPGQTVPITFGT